ncbi:anti-sigma factor [Bosea beijingensis]|uniref:anti-sigma factor n=1 Tax=Bosea beijingensis TaxID=3068632 RepID=UPI002741EC87|nr:anti-sigma factor [Bosea sp. REN20]
MTQEPDREILAGEYVLGLFEGAEKEAFEKRMAGDAKLDAAVTRWQTRLAPIDATARMVAPSSGLWQRIESGLDRAPAPSPAVAARPAFGARISQWWDNLWLWRGAALAGIAAALLLAFGLVAALDRARRQPVMVAVLLTDTNVAAAVVNTFADGRVELLPLQDIAVPQGRALEIWTLWDRAAGPRSVGLIDRARAVPLRLDNLPLGADQLFEITVEPATGSPTGRPTGPIVAKGLTTRRL